EGVAAVEDQSAVEPYRSGGAEAAGGPAIAELQSCAVGDRGCTGVGVCAGENQGAAGHRKGDGLGASAQRILNDAAKGVGGAGHGEDGGSGGAAVADDVGGASAAGGQAGDGGAVAFEIKNAAGSARTERDAGSGGQSRSVA